MAELGMALYGMAAGNDDEMEMQYAEILAKDVADLEEDVVREHEDDVIAKHLNAKSELEDKSDLEFQDAVAEMAEDKREEVLTAALGAAADDEAQMGLPCNVLRSDCFGTPPLPLRFPPRAARAFPLALGASCKGQDRHPCRSA
eukprot:1942206-Pyramimonas_sp.AAC.3